MPGVGEIRKFSDDRLQSAVDYAAAKADAAGTSHAIVMNYNINGEAKLGVVFRKGKHLSIGGFLEHKPKEKLAGLVEAVITF